MSSIRKLAMQWFNPLASAIKTQLCDTNTELLGGVRRWESLTGREIESLFYSEVVESWFNSSLYCKLHIIQAVPKETIIQAYIQEHPEAKPYIPNDYIDCPHLFEKKAKPKLSLNDIDLEEEIDADLELQKFDFLDSIKTRAEHLGMPLVGSNEFNEILVNYFYGNGNSGESKSVLKTVDTKRKAKLLREVDIDVRFELTKERESEIDQLMTDNTIGVEHLEQPKILKDFIEAIKSEFKDDNWDYLYFIADRVIKTQPEAVGDNTWNEVRKDAKQKFNLLPDKDDLVMSYWVEDYIEKNYTPIRK